MEANRTPVATQLAFLAVYLAANLTLTFLNKRVLQKFPYPILMTYLHAWISNLGCLLETSSGGQDVKAATITESIILVAFSLLFTLNISVSNASLGLVSIPLHSLIRATAPLFAIMILTTLFHQRFGRTIYASLLLVVIGVGLATVGDYEAAAAGLWLTLLGSFLAALKTVITNSILKNDRYDISSSRLLSVCLPLSVIQCRFSGLGNREWEHFRLQKQKGNISTGDWTLIAVDGAMAYVINVLSLATNKKAGALSMVVTGNLKQAMAVLIGYGVARSQPGLVHSLGIVMTLVGSTWYGIAWLKHTRHERPRGSGKK